MHNTLKFRPLFRGHCSVLNGVLWETLIEFPEINDLMKFSFSHLFIRKPLIISNRDLVGEVKQHKILRQFVKVVLKCSHNLKKKETKYFIHNLPIVLYRY